jgi:hypothetical protein
MEPHSNAAHGNAIPIIDLTRRLEWLDERYVIEGAADRITRNWELIHYLIDHPTDESCDMQQLAADIIEARSETEKLTPLAMMYAAPLRPSPLARMFE